jgi:acetyl-CoA carboxylase carboxyltransferase component
MRHLVDQLKTLEDRLRLGGGPAKIDRQHRAGKMAARERIAALLDPGTPFLEIGLLLAYDQYDGEAPCLGSVTGIGKIEGRYAVIIAGDATVKAGSWWPETVTKGLRAQEIAMRNRVPIVYLVDSAGVNLPYQDRIFPGQYGGGRIFYYNSPGQRQSPASARSSGSGYRGMIVVTAAWPETCGYTSTSSVRPAKARRPRISRCPRGPDRPR